MSCRSHRLLHVRQSISCRLKQTCAQDGFVAIVTVGGHYKNRDKSSSLFEKDWIGLEGAQDNNYSFKMDLFSISRGFGGAIEAKIASNSSIVGCSMLSA